IVGHEGAPTQLAVSTATVADPPVAVTGVSFSATEGASFTGRTTATFTDPGGAEPNAADPGGTISSHYQAFISWGDGTPASVGTYVATFVDPGGAEPNAFAGGAIADHYLAIINWGDGTTSIGAITYAGSPGSTTGVFTVEGEHVYGQEGGFTVTTTFIHEP